MKIASELFVQSCSQRDIQTDIQTYRQTNKHQDRCDDITSWFEVTNYVSRKHKHCMLPSILALKVNGKVKYAHFYSTHRTTPKYINT